jgi:hypothetical protein
MQKTWILASGQEVVDRDVSHIHAGVTDALLAEAFSSLRAGGEERIKHTHEFARQIGFSNCVKTQEGDEIVFARRVHRDGLTRFVKNRKPELSNLLTVNIRFIDGQYVLRTAYIGGPGAIEPWAATPDRFAESVSFWSANALCWGYEPIIADTETAVSPW